MDKRNELEESIMKVGDLVRLLSDSTIAYGSIVGKSMLVIDVVYHPSRPDKAPMPWVAEVYDPVTDRGIMVSCSKLEVIG